MSSENTRQDYGVLERFEGGDYIAEALVELKINGFTLLDSGLSSEFLDQLKPKLDRIYEKQVEEVGGDAVMAAINDTDIARCLLAYEPDLMTVARNPNLLRMAEAILGPQFVLMQQNAILNRPERKNYQINWHRDFAYQHWTSSQTVAFNALLCVDEFTLENGASYILPGTHLVTPYPSDAYVKKFEKQVAVPAGTFVVFDAMVFHRGGHNVSNGMRRAVNHVVGRPFMAQQIDIPSELARNGVDVPNDPDLRRYLGYRWSPASSATEWRTRKIQRLAEE